MSGRDNDASAHAQPLGGACHVSSYRQGDTVLYRILFLKKRAAAAGATSFRIEEYEHASEAAVASLFVVKRDPSQSFSESVEALVENGGPSDEQLVPAFGHSETVNVFHGDGFAYVELLEYPMPGDTPMYLVLRNARGESVRRLLFGPLYEDTSGADLPF